MPLYAKYSLILLLCLQSMTSVSIFNTLTSGAASYYVSYLFCNCLKNRYKKSNREILEYPATPIDEKTAQTILNKSAYRNERQLLKRCQKKERQTFFQSDTSDMNALFAMKKNHHNDQNNLNKTMLTREHHIVRKRIERWENGMLPLCALTTVSYYTVLSLLWSRQQ